MFADYPYPGLTAELAPFGYRWFRLSHYAH